MLICHKRSPLWYRFFRGFFVQEHFYVELSKILGKIVTLKVKTRIAYFLTKNKSNFIFL